MKNFARIRGRWIILLPLSLTACAPWVEHPVPRQVAFREAAFAPYAGAGTASVSGQVSVTDSYGQKHLGDQCHVLLLPVTAYTKESVERVIENGEQLAGADPAARRYVRQATADAEGNFTFSHLPAGDYYVAGLAEWSDGDGFSYQWACTQIKLAKGGKARIALSKDPRLPGKVIMADSGLGFD